MMKPWMPLMLTLLAGVAHAAYEEGVENRPCLDYWAVGNTKGCQKPAEAKKPAPAPKPPSPTVPPVGASQPPSSTLDKKIDEFLANHGKPPREFVAFYLDPTPEHAIQWVAKYNELLQRGQDIAVAWTQAETLYDDALKAGVPSSTLNPNAFAPVPDFGIPIPGITTPAYTQLANGAKGAVVPADVADLPPAQAMAALQKGGELEGVEGLIKPNIPQPSANFNGKPLEVSYYFSAVCPYCKRFEPGFREVIKAMGASVRLTCVDVTPEMNGNAPNPSNVHDLPCTWREPEGDELTQVGVKQTPSLIISHGPDQPLQRVSGYVEPSKLLTFFASLLK